MLAFIIAPFFIALLIFIFDRVLRYIKTFNFKYTKALEVIAGIILFGGLFFVLCGFFLPATNVFKRPFTRIGFYWFGIILYFFVGLLIALICRILIWIIAKNKGYNKQIARNFTLVFVIVFTLIMNIYGVYNAHNLKVVNYEVTSNKKSTLEEMNIVLISDLHLGYNVGLKEIDDMVNKINELNPDVVVLAGDIFDNEFEGVEKPEEMAKLLNSINSKYGKFAVYGNHDIEEKILMGFTFSLSDEAKKNAQADERMNKFIEDSGFELLYDSSKLLNNSVYIYGRPDAIKINKGKDSRVEPSKITDGLNSEYTIICVDHEPGQLQELAAAGVDLDLSGHTHNGQVWPGTLSINLFWDNAYGMKKINNMTSIVTSGVGLFGVNMRTGSIAEIVNIKLNFKK